MKVDIKLYKTFDADLISLNANGISISAMIKVALYRFSRGQTARFYIPECKPFNLTGLKRQIHVVTAIEDEESIKFLKNEIKPRERSAFIRTLLRECLMTQQLGAYLKNPGMIQKETARFQALNLESYDNVYVLSFEKRKHDYASEILLPAGEKPKKIRKKEKAIKEPAEPDLKTMKKSNRFGDVSDLALTKDTKKKLEAESEGEKTETIQSASAAPSDKTISAAGNPMSISPEPKKENQKPEKTAAEKDKIPWDDAKDIVPVNNNPDDSEYTTEDEGDALSKFDGLLNAFDFD